MRKPVRRINTKPTVKTVSKPSTTTKVGTKVTNKTTISAKSAHNKSGFDRGSAGFEKARQKRERQDEEYQRKKDTPFNFWLAPGDSAEIILLDKGEPFFVSLHKVRNAAGKFEDAVCIADTGQNCPLCASLGKEGSYTMVLTCLDRRSYKSKNGKVYKNTKKLLFVKGRNLPKFQRLYEGKASGNFRGFKLMCRRDGEKESAMGEDIEFGVRVSEDFLAKFGDNAKPANYTKIFEMPSAEELTKRYGIVKGKVAGAEEFGKDDDEYDSDDVGWEN